MKDAITFDYEAFLDWTLKLKDTDSAEPLYKKDKIDCHGDYLLPNKYFDDLSSLIKKYSDARKIATINRTKSYAVFFKYDTTDVAEFINEGDDYPETVANDWNRYKAQTNKLGTIIKVDYEKVYDKEYNVTPVIIDKFAHAFAVAEDKAFILGSGNKQPIGILNAEKGAEIGLTAASKEEITYDEIVDLYFSLDKKYRKNACFIMNDKTACALRKVVDSTGNHIYNDNKDTILGKPVLIFNDMPDIGEGSTPVAFGDYSYYHFFIIKDVYVKPLKDYTHLKSK